MANASRAARQLRILSRKMGRRYFKLKPAPVSGVSWSRAPAAGRIGRLSPILLVYFLLLQPLICGGGAPGWAWRDLHHLIVFLFCLFAVHRFTWEARRGNEMSPRCKKERAVGRAHPRFNLIPPRGFRNVEFGRWRGPGCLGTAELLLCWGRWELTEGPPFAPERLQNSDWVLAPGATVSLPCSGISLDPSGKSGDFHGGWGGRNRRVT